MKAYHGSHELKMQVLRELQEHYDADNFTKGVYWEGGKGCAVGCLLKSADHIEYEERFGIPVAIAHLKDLIFEGLSNTDSKEWPIRIMSAIKPGTDLSNVVWEFLIYVLKEVVLPTIRVEDGDEDIDEVHQHQDLINNVIKMIETRDFSSACDLEDIADDIEHEYDDVFFYAARAAGWVATAARSSEEYTAEDAAEAATNAVQNVSFVDLHFSNRNGYSYIHRKYADKLVELIENVKD